MHYTFPSIKEKQEKLALTLHQKIEFLNIFFPNVYNNLIESAGLFGNYTI